MAKMMIRGGDLDLVEFEFSSFSPGEKINTLNLKKNYALKPVRDMVRVKAPARIHLTVLDMNRIAPGHPGGGGVGPAHPPAAPVFDEADDADARGHQQAVRRNRQRRDIESSANSPRRPVGVNQIVESNFDLFR